VLRSVSVPGAFYTTADSSRSLNIFAFSHAAIPTFVHTYHTALHYTLHSIQHDWRTLRIKIEDENRLQQQLKKQKLVNACGTNGGGASGSGGEGGGTTSGTEMEVDVEAEGSGLGSAQGSGGEEDIGEDMGEALVAEDSGAVGASSGGTSSGGTSGVSGIVLARQASGEH